MIDPARFDAAYYRRFYRDARTRASDPRGAARLAAFLASYARHLGVPVRRYVDVGCGTGDLLRALAREFPRAKAVGVEYSRWAAQRHGWLHASAAEFRADREFDLVVCNDVLQYLDDGAASRAIANLRASSRALLYVGVMTRLDRAEHCDTERSDLVGHFRDAPWYRRRLARDQVALGGGLFVRRELGLPHWELERPR